MAAAKPHWLNFAKTLGDSMTISFLALIIGLIGLAWSADQFIHGAASLAHNLGMSTFIIGLTMVALGTSTPEILVSVMAALEDAPGLAIGNAVGSSIANIGLVLGVTALIANLHVQQQIIKEDLPIALLVCFGVAALFYDQQLSVFDGFLLLLGFCIYILFLIRHKAAKNKLSISANDLAGDDPTVITALSEKIGQAQDTLEIEEELEEVFTEPSLSTLQAAYYFIVGLVILLLSSRVLVWGSENIAHHFGISETIIGLTLVALGTSLPELATSISSTLKGYHDIAIANVIGSNTFNMLTVLAIPGLLAPSTLEPGIWNRDLPVMIGLSVLLFLMVFIGKKQTLTWPKGLLLLSVYIGYYIALYQQGVNFSTPKGG